LTTDVDFRRAIEEIKLRAPMEDVVREYGAELVSRGNRLWACCPLHDEDTPSFAIGPDPGFWYCFGACRKGGDVLQFVQLKNNVSFRDALELMAARTGVELPRRRKARPGEDDGLAVLARAADFYRAELHGREGRAARAYLAERDISANTSEAFGLGWAPASGQGLVRWAERAGVAPKALLETGLVRERDAGGRPRDFFWDRLVIPIRDARGRVVGFGARRIDDDGASGPKYVNTSETPWFSKGRLIYGYDRALDDVRRGGHLILVEGYTDVMAAHQAGLAHVGAVLGTATTDQHAVLVRRAGARRVSLVFDGDDAGRQAAYRGIEGLLPLELDLEVVRLPVGTDPADLLAGGDSQPFLAQLEMARGWFDFVVEGLAGLTGRDLSREVDRALELFGRVPKPVHRESLVAQLAERLGMPVAALREQYRGLPERRRRASASDPDDASALAAAETPAAPVDRRVVQAYKGIVGAALVDASLLPRVRPLRDGCPNPNLTAILDVLLTLWDDEDADITPSTVMSALGDHPVRAHVASLAEYVHAAEDPLTLLEDELAFLARREHELERGRLAARVKELELAQAAGDPSALESLREVLTRLHQLVQAGPAHQLSARTAAHGGAPGV
jgi:DNA primase